MLFFNFYTFLLSNIKPYIFPYKGYNLHNDLVNCTVLIFLLFSGLIMKLWFHVKILVNFICMYNRLQLLYYVGYIYDLIVNIIDKSRWVWFSLHDIVQVHEILLLLFIYKVVAQLRTQVTYEICSKEALKIPQSNLIILVKCNNSWYLTSIDEINLVESETTKYSFRQFFLFLSLLSSN